MSSASTTSKRSTGGCATVFLIGFLVVWMISSVAIVVGSIRTYLQMREEYRLLASNNRSTSAEIINVWEDSDGENITYYISYRYEAPKNGAEIAFVGQEKLTKKEYQRYLREDAVLVRYYPPDPQIHRLEEFFRPPSLLWPILSFLFPVFGVGIIAVLFATVRASRQSARSTPPDLNVEPLVDLTSSDLFYQATRNGFSCPVCHRPFSEGLLSCPHRASNTCPYIEDALSIQPMRNFGLGAAIFGALLIASALTLFTPALQCLVPLGIVLFLFGLVLSLAYSAGLADPRTGQRWLIYRIFRWTLYESASGPAAAIPPVRAAGGLRRLPPSLAVLAESEHSAAILHRCLMLLAAEGQLEILFAPQRSSTIFSGEKIGIQFYLRLPDPPSITPQIDGALERQVLEFVRGESKKTEVFVRGKQISRMRDNPYLFSLKDLTALLFGAASSRPEGALVNGLVGRDAAQRGLGQMQGAVFKTFTPDEAGMRSAKLQNEEDRRVIEAYRLENPDIAAAFEAACVQAVKAMESSD